MRHLASKSELFPVYIMEVEGTIIMAVQPFPSYPCAHIYLLSLSVYKVELSPKTTESAS